MNDSDKVFEIYFSDLNCEAQTRLLRFLKIKNPQGANLDVFALAEVPKGSIK